MKIEKSEIEQDSKGYKFSTNSLLLSDFVKPKEDDILVEIGTGCGIISILLCKNYKINKIYAVEIQDSLYSFARQNIATSKFEKNITLINKDITKIKRGEIPKADIVFSNPPYIPKNRGRKTINEEKYIAKHEEKLDLKTLIKVSYKILKHKGKICLIYPTKRVDELIFEMKKNDIQPKTLQAVFSSSHSNSKLSLIEGVKNGKNGLDIIKPVIL